MSEQKQQAALMALLECNTLTDAAKKAGIARRTLYSYIHNDIAFARAYDEAQRLQAISSFDAMAARREQAHDVVMDILTDDQQPATVRLKAAQIILSSAADHEKTVATIASNDIAANTSLFDL